jgi:hypothetical protein
LEEEEAKDGNGEWEDRTTTNKREEPAVAVSRTILFEMATLLSPTAGYGCHFSLCCHFLLALEDQISGMPKHVIKLVKLNELYYVNRVQVELNYMLNRHFPTTICPKKR